MMSKCYVRAGVVASVALVAGETSAQETNDWDVVVGGGAFFGPEYLGSKEYGFAPGIIASVQKGPYFVKFNGLTATANVLPFESFYAGPLIGYGTGRKDVKDKVVDKLPDVDAELWVGGVVGGGYAGLLLQRDSLGANLEIAHDVMGDSGTTATFSVGYEINATERLAFGVDLSTTFVDGAYANAYYSVTSAGSAASGLNRYDSDAGFRDVTLDVSSRFAVNEHWGVGGMVGGSVLLGSMADSPIVKDRGEATSGHGSLFLWYKF
ncbi:MipA/OmpV family protein [Roseibium sediminicola]|uniref:MipA/OmpV family protein n=1 Tax=Roseibium sediminicola TaxID=2933272 RepID=A0ABT0GMD2_9HYPH|nr:MipA/OmpV family protein [Roseibium sp. CAU 1639]MCK7610578.1 MipA/OmpV family protein [Roseibium sp. CAU 1639]